MVVWVPAANVGGSGKVPKFGQVLLEHVFIDDFRIVQEIPFTARFMSTSRQDLEVHGLEVSLNVFRDATYYLVHLVLAMFVIISSVFCAYGQHPAELGGRLDLDFALLITATAFRLVQTSMIPPLSYFTRLDWYVYICFGFLGTITVSHAILPHVHYDPEHLSVLTLPPVLIDGEWDLIYADRAAFWFFLLSWLAFNVLSYGYVSFMSKRDYDRFVLKSMFVQEFFDSRPDLLDSGRWEELDDFQSCIDKRMTCQ
eukprot:TRINITY_DN110259_c0_g1_i1.p1 TRINITY_DN110259_c0_g1~~TRINITY_DN110259_c0_g1_i1.p1  ORF type:complete len:293 (-),score=15.68 TRINITY_DN110259_c0_g1_i1:65-829(-)